MFYVYCLPVISFIGGTLFDCILSMSSSSNSQPNQYIYKQKMISSLSMVDRVGGFRRKTRSKMRKNVRSKGKVSIRNFLQNFDVDDKVLLGVEPAYQNGMYHPRFYGKVGFVTKKVGTCYEVQINDGGKNKIVVAHPVHLAKA